MPRRFAIFSGDKVWDPATQTWAKTARLLTTNEAATFYLRLVHTVDEIEITDDTCRAVNPVSLIDDIPAETGNRVRAWASA